MQLDLATLMVMGSFVAGCTGVILLGVWFGTRKAPVLGLWAAANLVTAAGITLLMLGMTWDEPAFLGLGNIVLTLATGLTWTAACVFAGKRARPMIALCGALMLGFVSLVPALVNLTGPGGCVLSAAYLTAAALVFATIRMPPPPARWPLVAFLAAHAATLVVGAYTLFNGAPHQVPALLSLFGVIHFESIVFSVGTATLIFAMVKEHDEAAGKLVASIDSLTGIANRAGFTAAAEKALARCRHEGAPVSVVMFDLDQFKSINDSHGHAAGDAAIQKFSEVARSLIRQHDVLGRIGGEEFALVLPRSSIEPAYVRADRIRAAFAENCRAIKGHQVNASVSAGVSASADAGMTLGVLLEQADEALYRAKAAGRNRVRRSDHTAEDRAAAGVIRVA